MKAQFVVIKGAGEAREVLCFNRFQGTHWKPLERERKLRFPATRKFDTEAAAERAMGMAGGDRVENMGRLTITLA